MIVFQRRKFCRIKLRPLLSLLLCVFCFSSCAVYQEKELSLNPALDGKDVSLRRWWELPTREGDYSGAGTRTQEMGGVTIVGDTLFFGNLLGHFYAVDRFRGRVIWKAELPGGVESQPLVVEKMIFVGCNDGYLYALTVHGGRVLWKKDLAAEMVSQATFHQGYLYFQTGPGRIYAVDGATGKTIWEVNRPQIKDKSVRGSSRVAVANQRLYIGTVDGTVLVLNALDGTKVWERTISNAVRFSDVDTTPLITADKVIASAYDGKTYALSLKDGSVVWVYAEGAAFSPTINGDLVLLSTQNSSVDALDLKSGKRIWRAEFDRRDGMATALSTDGSVVAFGTTSGHAYLISRVDGHYLWRFRPGAGMTSAPALIESALYLMSNYGNLYAFSIH